MSMDLPFEPSDPAPMLDEHMHFSGGVVVMAAHVAGYAALVFRFAKAEGGFYPPIVLALEPDQLANLPGLVGQAAQRALEFDRGAS